jgi:hypothetical protein
VAARIRVAEHERLRCRVGEIDAQVLGDEPFPRPWRDAVRWYRRASREVAQRAAWGGAITEQLARLRDVAGLEALRRRYVESPKPWPAPEAGVLTASVPE